MKILFINSINYTESILEIPMGLLSLATILKANGYDVEIVDLNELYLNGKLPEMDKPEVLDWFSNYIIEKKGDIIGFYTLCSFYHNAVSVAQKIKKNQPGVAIIFGGPQASLTATDSLKAFPWIDFIAVGECETTILDIIHALSGEKPVEQVPGLAYRQNGDVKINLSPALVKNLDELLPPDFSLISYMNKLKYMSIDVGRGCPFSCRFCSTKTFWKQKFRMKSVDRIISEMENVYQKFGISHFLMSHDIFTLNNKYLNDFCNRLRAKKLPFTWSCSSRADTLDPETANLMKKSGCNAVFIGIETGSPRMQKLVNKNLDLEKAWKIARQVSQAGIQTKLAFIFGFPDETEDDLKQTLSFIMRAIRFGSEIIILNHFVMLSGTEYYEKYNHRLTFDEIVPAWSDGFIFEETKPLIYQHPEIFPHFFRTESHLYSKYLHLDIFVNFLSYFYKFVPDTFDNILLFYKENLNDLYLDFVHHNPDFGTKYQDAKSYFPEIENNTFALSFFKLMDKYIGNQDFGESSYQIRETFDVEVKLYKYRISLRQEVCN